MQIKKFDSINIIPFIDVMLVLLTIVLMTATFVVKGEIALDLPSADTGDIRQISETRLDVYITKEGTLLIDEESISLNAFKEMLTRRRSDTPVYLHTDKASDFQFFVDVLAPLKESGFSEISIVTIN